MRCYWAIYIPFPATIWYDFQRPIRVVKMGLSNCKGPHCNGKSVERSPKSIKLVGSHDCANWVNLVEIENAGFEAKGQFRSWEIPEPKPYSCYGIHIENTNGENATYVHIRNILMWENMHDY